MALGTKDFLSLADEHDSDRSLPLNVLLYLLRVLCSGWWSLSKMVSNLLRVLLSVTVVRQSSSELTTAPAFLTSLSSRPASLLFMLYAITQYAHNVAVISLCASGTWSSTWCMIEG